MDKAKRYKEIDCPFGDTSGDGTTIIPDKYGEYVLYSEYQTLLSKVDRYEKALNEIKKYDIGTESMRSADMKRIARRALVGPQSPTR